MRHIIYMLLVVSVPSSAYAVAKLRPVEGIAAIVNDEVISLYDIDQRVGLFLATSGIEETPEIVDRMRAQVLRSLVDETLQMQEATRVDIKIEDTEVDKSLKQLAAGNSMSLEEIREFLKKRDIDITTMRKQIKAELAWQQFVRRAFGGRIIIGALEIDEHYERAVRTLGRPRFLIREILLAPESIDDRPRINALANEIIAQLKQGIDFAAVARQVSASPSAASGGRIGWVGQEQLAPEINVALTKMRVGQVSSPILTPAGIYIISLDNKQAGAGGPLDNRYDLLRVDFPRSVSRARVAKYISTFRTCKAARADAQKMKARIAQRTGLLALRNLTRFA